MAEINGTEKALLQSLKTQAGTTFSVVGVTETVVYQDNVDFSTIDLANVIATLSGLAARLTAGATSTFNLRVGGTIDTADGTVRATFTASGAEAQKTNTGASFTKPATAGGDLVKITMLGDNAATVTTLRGISVQFKGA